MSTKAWRKIDKFYLILVAAVVLLTVPVIFTAKGIFSALIVAFDVEAVPLTQTKLDKVSLDKAVNLVYDKEIVVLEIKEDVLPVVPGEK